MVSEYGPDDYKLHQHGEGTKQREEERGCSREASRVDGISSDARERVMAVPDPKTRERNGQNERERSTTGEANM